MPRTQSDSRVPEELSCEVVIDEPVGPAEIGDLQEEVKEIRGAQEPDENAKDVNGKSMRRIAERLCRLRHESAHSDDERPTASDHLASEFCMPESRSSGLPSPIRHLT